MDKIIGLVTTTRSYSFKLNPDLYGGPRYETSDYFCSKSAQSLPQDEDAVSQFLFATAQRDVIDAVTQAIHVYSAASGKQLRFPPICLGMVAPVETQSPAPVDAQPEAPESRATDAAADAKVVSIETATATATDAATPGEYVVAEKVPETVPGTAPEDHKAIAERLKLLGAVKHDVTKWANIYFRFPNGKLTPAQYAEAFAAAEKYIKAHGLPAWCSYIAEKTTPAAPVENATAPAEDPAMNAATQGIEKRWPVWSPELTRIAALWCSDQVKDAGALDAFLAACGITAQTPPGRVESLLAISRHTAMSLGAQITEYNRLTGNPLSMLENDLSAAVGQPIRFAVDLPKDAVTNAFIAMMEKLKEKAK